MCNISSLIIIINLVCCDLIMQFKKQDLLIISQLLNFSSVNACISANELIIDLNIQRTHLSEFIKPLIMRGIVKQAFILSSNFKKKERAYKLSSNPFVFSYLQKSFIFENKTDIFYSSRYYKKFITNLKKTHLSMSSENYIIDNQLLIRQFEGGIKNDH